MSSVLPFHRGENPLMRRFSLCPLVLLVSLIWLSPDAARADWPQFRGPAGQGVSTETDVPLKWSTAEGARENIVWQTELPGAGTSSPIAFGDRIYVTAYTGFNVPGEDAGSAEDLKLHLIALSPSGKIEWTSDVHPMLPEQERIREEHGYASGTPAADDKRIYTFFGKSGAVAFDHSGKQLWQTPLGETLHGWGSAASPVLYKNLVIINAGVESESLVALDAATGKEKWRAEGIKESWNTPILVKAKTGKTELVVAIMGKILGFNPDTGEALWECDTDIGWYMAPSMVSHEDVVYSIGGRTGGGLAVRVGGKGNVTKTHRVWTGKKGSNVTSPIYHDGHLYWMHEVLGIAYCANAATGKMVYEHRVPDCSQVYASPVLAAGRIYHLARDGKTYVLPATPKYEVLAVNELDERGMFNSSFAVDSGRIYLRSNKYLYAIGEK
jgi:outer membrane protein assembly factor BamB